MLITARGLNEANRFPAHSFMCGVLVHSKKKTVHLHLDPQANLKMGVIITNPGEYWALCYYQPLSMVVSCLFSDSVPRAFNFGNIGGHLSVVVFREIQTMKIKKKIVANIPRDW